MFANIIVIAMIISVCFSGLVILLSRSLQSEYNPFQYPKIEVKFDISGKRNVNYEMYVENYLLELYRNNMTATNLFVKALNEFDTACNDYLKSKKVIGRKKKETKFSNMHSIINNKNYKMFKFVFYRNHVRYTQINYIKQRNDFVNYDLIKEISLQDLIDIDNHLRSIGYENVIRQRDVKYQRSLMTKELKESIMKRDNFTCQNCGKHMPDKVGLHIDHIIPVSKGGQSIPTNLQVLCDKCNCSKGDKLIYPVVYETH